MSEKVYDVIGIGLGPFNLGLAALIEEVPDLDALFLEKKPEFSWHPGMMIEGTTLQVPFLADLVSMVNVTSKYSFLNYLQQHDRLYQFYFLEKFHIPRKEYNHYCRWVSSQLNNCHYGMDVRKVDLCETENEKEPIYQVFVYDASRLTLTTYYTRNLVIGVGTEPAVPKHLRHALGASVFHSSEYLDRKQTCMPAENITVIGSGQSAAEVFLDLLTEQKEREFSLNWYTRSKGFFPMEYSKLGLEHFSPDYTSFFYKLPSSKKDELLKEQDLLYKGISAEAIADIYDLLYERSIGNKKPAVHLQAMSEINSIEDQTGKWRLHGRQQVSGETFYQDSDIVILGTGYTANIPKFLAPIYNDIEWDDMGRYNVLGDYRLAMKSSPHNAVFVQNAELHTHGVGTPDLGLGAYRNAVIINTLAGREIYPVQAENVFQKFGVKQSSELVHST